MRLGQDRRQRRRRRDHVLEVVEQEQRPPTACPSLQVIGPHCAFDAGDDHRRVGNPNQRHPPDAVGVGAERGPPQRDGKPGLADATRARDRQDAGTRQRLGGGAQLPLAADKRAHGLRQRGRGQAAQGREPAVAQLEQAQRLSNVLQPVVAQVGDGGVGEELAGAPREHDLAAVGTPGDPGRRVHVQSDVALLRHLGLARVQPHPHAHPPGRERRLGGCSATGGVGRASEGVEECVALSAHLHPAPLSHRLADDPAMSVQGRRIPVAELVQQLRRALDVREDQRDRPCRQLAHGARLPRPARRRLTVEPFQQRPVVPGTHRHQLVHVREGSHQNPRSYSCGQRGPGALSCGGV